jgi:hypothetical protein
VTSPGSHGWTVERGRNASGASHGGADAPGRSSRPPVLRRHPPSGTNGSRPSPSRGAMPIVRLNLPTRGSEEVSWS